MDDHRYQMVTCGSCGARYKCVPGNDYNERAADGAMVCDPCLLGFPPELSRRLVEQFERKRQAVSN